MAILPLPLIQEEQHLSVKNECTLSTGKLLTRSVPRNSVGRITDRPVFVVTTQW